MILNSWKECLENNCAILISPDRQKAKSLIKTAKGRIKFLQENKIKDENANYIFEGYYSSLIENIHAIAAVRGYKISNHVCLGYFILNVLKKGEMYKLFENCRFKRNSLLYSGSVMDKKTAIQSIKQIKQILFEIKDD
jgi:hypothetical protein